MRILILTDSLGLPRYKPDQVRYEETWPVLIKRNEFEIHTFSVGGWTTSDFIKHIKYYRAFQPDILIIQVGIVDCAPRFVTQNEKNVIKYIPFFGKRLLGFLNKKWIRKLRKITYVNKNEFKNNISILINTFPSVKRTILIEIVGSKNYEEVLEGVNYNIGEYNKILNSTPDSTFVEYYNNYIVMDDHHHINVKGHKLLSEKISAILEIEKHKLHNSETK